MKINFGNQTKSNEYAAAYEKIKNEPQLVKKLLNLSLDVNEQIELCRKYNIKFPDLQAMKKELAKEKTSTLTDGLEATVEEAKSIMTVDVNGIHIDVYGALISGNGKFGGNTVRDTAVTMLMDLMTIDKGKVSPAKISSNKDAALVKIDPILNVAQSLSEVNLETRTEMRDQLTLNFEDTKASKVLTNVVIDIAPAMAPMKAETTKVTTKNNKEVKVVLPVPVESEYLEFDEGTAEKILYRANQFSYPKTAPIHNTAARHVFGIPFSPQHRRYVDFLTDIRIPDEVNEVHMFCTDIVYAIALHNAYPRLKIAIVGKRVFSDDEIYLSYITAHRAKIARTKNDKIMGIWPVVEDRTQPNKKEKATQIYQTSKENSARFRKYKIRYRPLNVHAMDADAEYCLSVQVRHGVVIDGCGRGKSYIPSVMKTKVAAGIMHSYYFPFSWKSLYQSVKGYPPPLPRYSTLNKDINTKTKMFDIMKNYMKPSEASVFLRICSLKQEDDNDDDDADDDGDEEDNGDYGDDSSDSHNSGNNNTNFNEQYNDDDSDNEDDNNVHNVTTGNNNNSGSNNANHAPSLLDNGNNNSVLSRKDDQGGKKLVKAKAKTSKASVLNSFLDKINLGGDDSD